MDPVIQLKELTKNYEMGAQTVRALRSVNLDI